MASELSELYVVGRLVSFLGEAVPTNCTGTVRGDLGRGVGRNYCTVPSYHIPIGKGNEYTTTSIDSVLTEGSFVSFAGERKNTCPTDGLALIVSLDYRLHSTSTNTAHSCSG